MESGLPLIIACVSLALLVAAAYYLLISVVYGLRNMGHRYLIENGTFIRWLFFGIPFLAIVIIAFAFDALHGWVWVSNARDAYRWFNEPPN